MLTMMEIKDRIVEIIKGTTGIKLMELIGKEEMVDVIISLSVHNNIHGYSDSLNDVIDVLVKEERIIEIEYVLPYPLESGVPENRVKSFLLPANTSIRLKGGYYSSRTS